MKMNNFKIKSKNEKKKQLVQTTLPLNRTEDKEILLSLGVVFIFFLHFSFRYPEEINSVKVLNKKSKTV